MSGTNTHFNGLSAVQGASSPLQMLPIGCSREMLPEFHRIGTIRREQKLTLLQCAHRLGITIEEARRQEDPTCDLSISQLKAWRDLLDVPFTEILAQSNELEDPIRNRAQLVKVMKTAKQLQKTAREQRSRLISESLIDQLIELMPELRDVSAWPDIGQSHENKDYGQAVYRRFDSSISSQIDFD